MEPQEQTILDPTKLNIFKIKQISAILGVLVLVAGLSTGVALVQKQQDIREKAEGPTCSPIGKCASEAGCPNGYKCSSNNKCVLDNSCNFCPNTDCNIPPTTSGAIYCRLSTNPDGSPVYCCPTGKPLYDVDKKACVASGGGGLPPSDGGGGCSSASASKCQGKSPGDSCGSGKTCQALSQKGADGKPKCECKSKSSGGTSPSSSPDSGTATANGNPTKIGPFNSSGLVKIFFQPKDYKIKIALKKNADSCSLTNKDVLLESSSFSSTGIIDTGINVSSEDFLCIYIENVGTDASKSYPALGWTAPTNNKCGQGQYDKVDISSLVSQVTSAGLSAFSTQCWGDFGEEPDYNDFAMIFSVTTSSTRPSLCQSLSVSKTANSIILTSTAKEAVNNFTYAFYNEDNQYPYVEGNPQDNPKPICVISGGDTTSQTSACPAGSNSHHLIFKDSNTSLRTTGSKTLTNSDIFVADKNYNDQVVKVAHVVAYFSKTNGPTSIPEGPCVVNITPTTSQPPSDTNTNILFRLQGITEETSAQSFTVSIKNGDNVVASFPNTLASANTSGVFTATINASSFCSETGKFDVLIKGESHLAKKFENVSIKCGSFTLDKSSKTSDELKAGDVNGDNLLTVEDIAKVLSYYTTFSTKATGEMKSSDINKDGYITIVDVALVALNWTDFVIPGDE